MSDRDFLLQVQGYGLMTAEISYYMPDHPALIQLFVYQQYDVAPRFPVLHKFLDHWRSDIEAVLHSVRVVVPPDDVAAVIEAVPTGER